MRLPLSADQEFEARKLALMHASLLGDPTSQVLPAAKAYLAFLIGDEGKTPLASITLDRAA